jgi:hypothetical protein
MKLKTLVIALALVAGLNAAPAHANEQPVVESLTYSPGEVDLAAASTAVTVELVVSHPAGIENTSTYLTLSNGSSSTISAYLVRTDNPANPALTKVTFKATINVPRDVNPGAYTPTIAAVRNNSSAGYQYATSTFTPTKNNSVVGAETALLIRNNGDLNFDYQTYNGPTYATNATLNFTNTAKYNSNAKPIWKVGEVFNPSDFFESRVSGLGFDVSSSTPTVCAAANGKLTLLKEGGCSYSVFTPKTKDYISKKYDSSVTITAARIKPALVVDTVTAKLATDVGKTIALAAVYNYVGGLVLPQSTTPLVCLGSGSYAKLVGTGTCILTYQTEADTSYAASDLYKQTFIVGTATPVATPTPTQAPVVVKMKTVTCIKSKKSTKGTATKKVTGTNPKCPTGYKLKK